MRTMTAVRALAVLLMTMTVSTSAAAVDLLPDIIVRDSSLYEISYDQGLSPGQVILRLSNATANIGAGPLYLYGVSPPLTDSTRQVNQRIFRDDLTWWDRSAGVFINHSEHGHIHFENWAQYRVRQWLPGDGVGPILAEGAKTSFCLMDGTIYDSTLPGFPPIRYFWDCDTIVQGISVGWYDEYGYCVPGQEIDITGLANGATYWLESEVDPDSLVLESNESNNVSRVKFVMNIPSFPAADAYESNDSVPEVMASPLGGLNSSNIGPCGPELIINQLTRHRYTQRDYYRFYFQGNGNANHFVAVTRDAAGESLNLLLLDSVGGQIKYEYGSLPLLRMDLAGLAAGWYFVEVAGYCGLTPSYSLWIQPPQNASPSVNVTSPPVDATTIVQGATFSVEWAVFEPDDDPWWATVYRNDIPDFDGNETLVAGARLIGGSPLSFDFPSLLYPPNPCFFYVEITDGGTTVGDWSDGPLNILPCECTCGNDPGCDGTTNVVDVVNAIGIGFRGMTPMCDADCPFERTDVNCDSVTDIVDVIRVVNAAFRGADAESEFCSPCNSQASSGAACQ